MPLTFAFKSKLRSLFKGNHAAANSVPKFSSNDVTVLNADEDLSSPDGLSWLLKCIFRDSDVYQYAKREIGARIETCETYQQANCLIYDHFRNKVASSELTDLQTLDCRALQSILTHQIETRRNQQAYTGDQTKAESGFWPNPSLSRNGRSLYEEFPFRRRFNFITPQTPLASAGSCFAVQIAHALQRDGFNYVVTERTANGRLITDPREKVPSESSAAWGIIFNTPGFRQLTQRAFGLRRLPRILWEDIWQDRPYYMDPFRESIKFTTIEEYVSNYDSHIDSARNALLKAEVFIITLGLNEIWTFKMDNSVFSRSPWRIAPSFVEYKVPSIEENVAELQLMLDILRRFNPNIKIIVTLSPIPLHATFLHETHHVVEANMHSKAVLRIAAKDFVERNEGVFYFPSFELITFGVKNPWTDDERHVSPSAVARVMDMFREMFVA